MAICFFMPTNKRSKAIARTTRQTRQTHNASTNTKEMLVTVLVMYMFIVGGAYLSGFFCYIGSMGLIGSVDASQVFWWNFYIAAPTIFAWVFVNQPIGFFIAWSVAALVASLGIILYMLYKK